MCDALQSIFRFSLSIFLLGLKGFMSMIPLRDVDFASASTTVSPWVRDQLIDTFQYPVDTQTGVAHSGRAPTLADAPANSTAQKASQDLISMSMTGQADTGWGPMPAMTQSVAGPPSKSPQPVTSPSRPQ